MELQAGIQPEPEFFLRFQLVPINGDPSSSHRTTLPHLRPPGARSQDEFCVSLRCDARKERVARDRHDHTIVPHEGDTAEHLHLAGGFACGQRETNALCKFSAVFHGVRPLPSSRASRSAIRVRFCEPDNRSAGARRSAAISTNRSTPANVAHAICPAPRPPTHHRSAESILQSGLYDFGVTVQGVRVNEAALERLGRALTDDSRRRILMELLDGPA